MKCYKCGKELPSDIKFCSKCGAIQQASEDLIKKAINNDQMAIEQLYNMAFNNVYHTVRSMIRDDDTVLDILQDSFIKGFKNLEQLKDPAKYRAWMKRIAHNKTVDYLRKAKPAMFSEMVSTDSDEMIDFKDERTASLPEAVADQNETTRLMNEILSSLSDEQRLVVGMYYYEQMSVKEIAEILGVSENTVKSRLSYGRKKIEMMVKELEKKGTKLYGLAPVPFLLWLFKCTDVQACALPSQKILQTVTSQCTHAGTAAANTTSGSFAANGTAAAESAVKSAAAKGVTTKILVGAVAAAVIGGGYFAGTALYDNHKPAVQEDIEDENAKTNEDVMDELPLAEDEPVKETGYQAILDEYAAARGENATADNISALLAEKYPDVNSVVMENCHSGNEETCKWYYAHLDIDQNGTDELLIGHAWSNDLTTIPIVDLYSTNNGTPEKLLNNDTLGERASVTIFTDGTIYEESYLGAGGDQFNFWKIDADGHTPVMTQSYGFNASAFPDKPYFNDKEALTRDEYDNMISNYTEITNINWIPLETTSEQTSTEGQGYQAILDEYLAARSEDADINENNIMVLVAEKYPNVNSVMMGYYLSGMYGSSDWYYAYFDIDGNGTDELLIGTGTADNLSMTSIVDLYSDNKGSAERLIKNTIGERSIITLLTDGSICEQRFYDGGAEYTFWKIDEDGHTPVQAQYYDLDLSMGTEAPFFDSQEYTYDGEYDILEGYTPVTNINWLPLETASK